MWRGRPVGESGTPVPRRENEVRGVGAGPVITYTMSPEEIAARYGPPGSPAPIKEEKPMANQSTERKYPTKEEYLHLRAEGLSNRKIERRYDMSVNTIYPLIKTWGLNGVDAEKAQMLLDEMAIDNPRPAAEESTAQSPEPAPEPTTVETPAAKPHIVQEPAAEPAIALVDEPENYQIMPAATRSKRSMRIEVSGSSQDIEEELVAMLSYIQAMPRKSFRLELYLGEVAE